MESYLDKYAAMDKYIDDLKAEILENPVKAKEKAIQSLIRSGVFNADGTPKERICTANHLSQNSR